MGGKFWNTPVRYKLVFETGNTVEQCNIILEGICSGGNHSCNDCVGSHWMDRESAVWDDCLGSTMLGGDGHRYAMGYGHPNMASAVLFFWTIMYFVVKRRLTVWNVVFGIAVNYWLYTYTGSRTSFLLTLLVLPLMWCLDKYFKRIWQKLFLLAAAFLPVGNVLLQICYRPESTVYSIFNKLLSGRIGLGHDGFYNFGVLFFGQTIVWNSSGTEYNIVDNAYMYILVSFETIFIF